MTSLVRPRTFTDHCQKAYNEAQKVANIKVYKNWTVFDIAKVVAVATSIFIGLHYIFGSSLLKAYSLAKWYRSVYEPFDHFTLTAAAITSTCSFVYYVFRKFAPVEIDLLEAKRLGVREYVQHYRTILTSQPVDFWTRSQKYDLLEILDQKICRDPSSLNLIANSAPVQEALLKHWREKLNIPFDFQGLTTQQLLAFRSHVLTARKDIPWQKETKNEICIALMRSIERKPQEATLVDPTLEDTLKEVFLSNQGNLGDKSIVDLAGIIQDGEQNLPWQQALKQAALEALARKIEPQDIALVPLNLRHNLLADQRNLPFIAELLAENNRPEEIPLREHQYDQERLKRHAIALAVQFRQQGQGQETALAQTLKWCLDLRKQTGEALGDDFYRVMTDIEADLYATLNHQNVPAQGTRDILVDLLLYKSALYHNESPRIHYIDLGHIQKLFPLRQGQPPFDQGQPKIQTLMAMVLADHLFRLVKNEALAQEEIAPEAIPGIERILQNIIAGSTVSLTEVARHFANSLERHPGIDTRRGFTRNTTEGIKVGWGQWIRDENPRIRAVIHLFMYVISAADVTAIDLSRERLMEAIAALIEANKAAVLQGDRSADLNLFLAELNTLSPSQNVNSSDSGQKFQRAVQDLEVKTVLHPHYLPPSSPQLAQASAGLFNLFGANPAIPAPQAQFVGKEVRLPSLIVTRLAS